MPINLKEFSTDLVNKLQTLHDTGTDTKNIIPLFEILRDEIHSLIDHVHKVRDRIEEAYEIEHEALALMLVMQKWGDDKDWPIRTTADIAFEKLAESGAILADAVDSLNEE